MNAQQKRLINKQLKSSMLSVLNDSADIHLSGLKIEILKYKKPYPQCWLRIIFNTNNQVHYISEFLDIRVIKNFVNCGYDIDYLTEAEPGYKNYFDISEDKNIANLRKFVEYLSNYINNNVEDWGIYV